MTSLTEAIAAHRAGRYAEAQALCEALLATDSQHYAALHLLGVTHIRCARPEQGLRLIEQALRIKPDYVNAIVSLGNALCGLQRNEEAVARFREALAIRPDDADAHSNLGSTLAGLERDDEALRHYQQALAIDPGHAEANNNMAALLTSQNRLEEAIAHLRRALATRPGFADAEWNWGLAALCLGRYAEGWPRYEKRLPLAGRPDPSGAGLPLWPGDADIAGRKLLIEREQGYGDEMQMLRYVPLLEQRGVECWIQTAPALHALLQRSFPKARLLSVDQSAAATDFRIPLMSLPLAMRTFSESAMPAAVPYLHADAKKSSDWAQRLGPPAKRRVGLVWRGSAGHRLDRKRSMKLEALAPLLERTDIHFVTLQKDLAPAESDALGLPANVTVLDCELTSFDETAAVMSALDLVICVDTAAAHLAGALGVKTWILLPFSPDWRWQLGRSDSPWYPTARLFRQQSPGDWAGVVRDLSAALALPWPDDLSEAEA